MPHRSFNISHISAEPSKRSDRIADDIKRWVMDNELVEGDKLPHEKQLIEIFSCAKGTIREALKSLEVQGLISIRTGPSGGPTLIQVSHRRTSDLLRNFMQFRDISVEQIYQLRKVIEVELAVSVVGLLPQDILERLSGQISGCCAAPASQSRQNQHLGLREKELDFHDVLAEYCPNPLIGFHAKFLNELLRNFIEFRYDHISQYETFTHSNINYHRQLVDAYKANDVELVREIMTAHMIDCEKHTLSLNATLTKDLLLNRQ
ncbi:MAG: GntR family transcriptional regulator [Hyphomicrobiales bacterium]|nr:MAG: GntR family transcriptional regulator [Hyphomicrobiales bacterium]